MPPSIHQVLATIALAASAAIALISSHPAAQAPEAKTPMAARKRKEADAGERQARKDVLGDPLPPEALVRLGTVRLRTGGFIGYLHFSADGKKLISASNNGLVHYWDAATGKPLRRLRTLSWAAANIKLSPDGKLIAAIPFSQPTTIALWDTATERMVRRLEQPAGGKAYRLAFSPDGKTLVSGGGQDNKVCFWDVARGKLLQQLTLKSPIHLLDFSPDGRMLVSRSPGSPGWVHLWDPRTAAELHRFKVNYNNTYTYAFSPDSKILAAGCESRIDLWELATGKKLGQFQGDRGIIQAVAYSPDGKTLASANSSSIHFWDIASRKELAHAITPWGLFDLLHFAPDGKTVASGSRTDTAIRLWDVAKGKELQQRPGHSSGVRDIAFSSDGALVATHASDSAVRVWRAATGEQQQILPVDSKNPVITAMALRLPPDGKTVIFGDSWGVVHVRGMGKSEQTRRFSLREDARRFDEIYVRGLAVSGDGKMLTALAYHMMHERNPAPPKPSVITAVWNLTTGELIRKRDTPTARNENWTLAPDGNTWATFSQGARVSIHDVATGQHLLTIDGQCESVWPAVFSPDSRFLAGVCHHGKAKEGIDAYLSSIVVWELASGAEVRRFRLKPGSPEVTVAFSADGRILASGGEETVGLQLWDLTTGAELHRYADPGATVRSLSLDAANQRLASGLADGTTLLWDTEAFIQCAGPRPKPLAPSDLERLWADLAGKDAAKAHQAVWTLAAVPAQAVPFLKEHLRPAAALDSRIVRPLIADLDNPEFAVREAAQKKLASFGEQVEPALRQALHGKPPLETRKRLEALHSDAELAGRGLVRPTELVRTLRAICTLEHIGDRQAQGVLQTLAAGNPAARSTRQAKAALKRLER